MAQVALAPIYNASTYFDNNGQMLSGGMLFAYQAGSFSVLQTTYKDSAATIQNSNPIVLNSSGRMPNEMWLDATIVYNLVLTMPDGVTVLQSSNNVTVNTSSIIPTNFNATPYADATGTGDVVLAGYTVTNPVLYDGYYLTLGISAANTTTTATFTPTLNGVVQAARPFEKFVNNVAVPLAVGDLQGSVELRYDLPRLAWTVMSGLLPSIVNQTLTYAATVTLNAALGSASTLILTGNAIIANPINLVVGAYIMKIVQDATGSRTVTWGTAWKFPGGVVPVLSTTANAVDIISAYSDGTNMYASYMRGMA
jgi:hypothetical protein